MTEHRPCSAYFFSVIGSHHPSLTLVLEPVALAGDRHNVGMMQQPVKQGCG